MHHAVTFAAATEQAGVDLDVIHGQLHYGPGQALPDRPLGVGPIPPLLDHKQGVGALIQLVRLPDIVALDIIPLTMRIDVLLDLLVRKAQLFLDGGFFLLPP